MLKHLYRSQLQEEQVKKKNAFDLVEKLRFKLN